MRFLEHFTSLEERDISRAERVCRKQAMVLVVSWRRAWQRLPVGVDRGEAFGRRVSFLAEGVKRDSEEAHLLKTVASGGPWHSEVQGEEALLTRL